MKFSLASALVVSLAAEATVASSWFSKAGMSAIFLQATGAVPKRASNEAIAEHLTDLWDAVNVFQAKPNPSAAVRVDDAAERFMSLDLDGMIDTARRASVARILAMFEAAKEQFPQQFRKHAYNKWHETELERWLSDHDVPYPTPADRKDLENLVKSNWNAAVESPYVNWDTNRMSKYMNDKGAEVSKEATKNKDQLAKEVKNSWYATEGQASNAYGDVRAWIFDSWTESALKSFCDKHSIPVPQPRKRDTLLKAARENYQTAANKAGETSSYPGNWLYDSWSDSELKAWLDERGIPAPQTGKRDKMIASVRRNAYVASHDAQNYVSSASKSAASAQQTLSNAVFDAWSDSEIKAWADKNGINVPQGSNRNEMLSIARKNAAKLTGDNIPESAKSAYGAATSSAGNQYAKASQQASTEGNNLFAQASSYANHYFTEAQIALGLQTNYMSSASRSAASAAKTASAKAEL